MPDPILDALLSQPVSERPFDPADEGYASDLSGYVKEGIAETVGKLKFVPKFEQKSIIESGPVGAGAKVGANALAGAANFILGIPEFLLGAGTDVAIGGLHYGAAATKQVMMDPVEESKYMEELKKKGLGEDYLISKAKEYGQGLLGAWRTDISTDERVKMIEEDPISAIMPLLVAAGTAKSAGVLKGKESVRVPGTPGEKLTIIAESENSPAWERVQAKKALAEQVDQSLINRLTKFYDKNQEKLYKLEEPGEQGRVAPVAEIPIDDPQALIAAREKIASQIASVQQPILKAVLEQTDKALEEKINEIQKAPESPAPAAGRPEAPSALPEARPPSEAVPAATSTPTPTDMEGMSLGVGKGRADYTALTSLKTYRDLVNNYSDVFGNTDKWIAIDNLSNEGSKGDGLLTFKQAVQAAHERGKNVLVWAKSERTEKGAQAKLEKWYESTGVGLEKTPYDTGEGGTVYISRAPKGKVESAAYTAKAEVSRQEISQTAKVRELDAKSEQSFVTGIKEGHKAVREKYLGDHNQQKAISLFKNRWLKDHNMDLTPAEKQVYDPLVAITVDHLKTGDIAAALTEIDSYINTLSKFGKDMPIKRDYVEFAKKVREMFKKRQDEERASTGELTKDITEKSKLKEIDEARENKRKFDNIENAVTEQEHAAAEAAAIADEIFSAERNLEDMRKMNMEKPEVSVDKATREAGLSKVELAPEPVAEGGKFSANEQIAEAYQLYREAGLDAVKQLPNGWPGKAEIIAQAETGKVTKSFLNKVLKENAEKAAIVRGPKPLGITAGSVLEAERAQKAQTEANLRDLTRPEVEKALSPDMLKLLDQEKGRPGQGSRLAKRLVNWFNSIMRSFRFGWDERAHPEFVEDMRLASGAYRRSLEKAMDAYADIAIHLKNPAEYEIFKQIVVGWDLLETAMRGEQLPFGMTKAEVAANLVKSNSAITPGIRAALEARTNLWQGVAQHLEAKGKLRPGTARSDYFRHEVIRYSDGLTFAPEFGKSSAVRDPYRPYLKKRGGSEAPIRTDVAYVDIKTLTKILLDDARENFLYDTLRKNNDRSKINSMGLPDQGWRIYHPKLGLRHTMTGLEEMIQRKIEESIANGDIVDTAGPELIGNMRIQLLNKGNWYVIPEAIAHRLNNLMETGPRRDIIDAINDAHGKWKAVVLTAAGLPFQLVNLTGDLCNMYRENAQAFRQLGPAVREVWNAEIKKNPSDFYRALRDNEVTSSGYTLSELSDVFYDKRFSHLRDNSPLTMLAKAPSQVLAAIRHIGEVRESIPRVAMAKELGTEAGKKHLQKYHKADVEALGFERAGLKTAREFTVDYGRFTRFENRYLRGMLVPFWSWLAGNTYQWGKFHVTRPAEMLYKFYAPMYMTHVWNNTGPRKKVEEELQKTNPGIANSTHIITGLKDGNGKNIILSLRLPIDDFLNVWRDPEGTIASGMTPVAKVPISLFAGKDVFTGAKIRPEDRTSYAIQNFVPLTRQAATEERKEAYGDPQGKFEKWAKSPIGLGALVQFYSDESLDMGSKWSEIRRRVELRDKLKSMATNRVWRLREEKDPGYLDNKMQPLVEEIQKDLEQRGMLSTFLFKMVPLSESSIPGAAVGTGQYVKEKFE